MNLLLPVFLNQLFSKIALWSSMTPIVKKKAMRHFRQPASSSLLDSLTSLSMPFSSYSSSSVAEIVSSLFEEAPSVELFDFESPADLSNFWACFLKCSYISSKCSFEYTSSSSVDSHGESILNSVALSFACSVLLQLKQCSFMQAFRSRINN